MYSGHLKEASLLGKRHCEISFVNGINQTNMAWPGSGRGREGERGERWREGEGGRGERREREREGERGKEEGENGKLGTTSEGFSTIQQIRIGETCM